MAKFDHERAHMAANLVSDPPVNSVKMFCLKMILNNSPFNFGRRAKRQLLLAHNQKRYRHISCQFHAYQIALNVLLILV